MLNFVDAGAYVIDLFCEALEAIDLFVELVQSPHYLSGFGSYA